MNLIGDLQNPASPFPPVFLPRLIELRFSYLEDN
jgi:hypothetical protein